MDISKDKIYPLDMPMGLDIALAENKRAFNYFYSLSEAEQKRIIDGTHTINSRSEMQSYVESFVQ